MMPKSLDGYLAKIIRWLFGQKKDIIYPDLTASNAFAAC